MKLSVASSVLSLLMTYGDVLHFVRGVEVGSGLALRASQSHEMGRTLVDKAPFKSQWVQVGPKTDGIVGGVSIDQRGMIAMSSDGSVVATGIDQNGGEVRVFKNEGGSLKQMGRTFVGVEGHSSDFVSLSGDGKVLAIASPVLGDGVSPDVMGYVKVYQYDETNSTWTEQTSDIKELGSSHTNKFGVYRQLQLSGDGKTLVVGDLDYTNSIGKVGMFLIYKYDGERWVKKNDFYGGFAQERLGVNAISHDGSVVAVLSHAQFVTIYDYNDEQDTYIKGKRITAPETTIAFGSSTSISSNGNILAIGDAHAQNSKGEINIYEKNDSGEWVSKGAPITGDVLNAKFSHAVNLSHDGNTIAVGSREYDGIKGRIRVFDFVDGAWTEQVSQIKGDADGDSLAEIGLASDGDIIFAGALGGGYAATYYYLQDWKIYKGAFDVDTTTGDADVYHLIGDKPEAATVKLYNKDCVGDVLANDINAVSLIDDSWNSVEHKLIHKLTLDTTKINQSPLVTFATTAEDGTESQNSIGSIEFCTRVETFMTSSLSAGINTAVTFFETNYKIDFDLTKGEAFTISTTIVSDAEAEQQTDLEVDLTVTPFFCSANSFAAQTGSLQIQQNERVYVCLNPVSDEVKISNLDMKLIGANDFEYQPIEFGATSWEADAITEVVADPASDVVRADLFPVASLFANVSTDMKIEGKAFLEFKNSATRMLNFAPYDMTVELAAVPDEDCSGGLASIFGALFGK